MTEAVFTSWPVDGSKPAISFYYNKNEVMNVLTSDNFSLVETAIHTNDTDPTPIGYMQVSQTITNNSYNDLLTVMFVSGGSISFQDNQLGTDHYWGSNQELIFRITDGNGPYLFVEGYFVINTDDKGGRYVKVYFGINKKEKI